MVGGDAVLYTAPGKDFSHQVSFEQRPQGCEGVNCVAI